MATVRNAIDKILQAATTRTTNLAGARVLLTPTTNAFHVTTAGVADPASITFTAGLIDLEGAISFSAVGGTLTGGTATSAVLAYANMSAATATITATVTANGQPYTATCHITKVQDGAKGDTGGQGDPGTKGDTGASGTQVATARMYQWATTAPAKPTGTTTWTWATGANSSYSASDGWAVVMPANPGTPLAKLYTADMPITALAGVVSSTVSYASSTVSAVSQNGGNGATGTNGLQSFAPTVYQWAATIPAGPAGADTLTWATRAFGAAPTGWSLTPGTAPSPGFTLWAAPVQVSDSAANPTTAFNWSSAAVIAIGYAGGNGTPGAEGASYVTAYCASTTGATSTAPAPTTGKTSLPATNSGGLAGTYSATVPALAAGQYLYQTDGIYNPATNQIIWSIPYWSSLKVATLSAITANLGAINAGSIDLGSGKITMDNAGNAVFQSITIKATNGDTILASGVPLNPAYAAPGTKNSDIDMGLGGRNLIQSNSLPSSLSGFIADISVAGFAWEGPLFEGVGHAPNGLDVYSPNRAGCVYVHALGTPAINTFIDIYKDQATKIPVVAGRRYEVSAALSTHRCNGQVGVTWYDSAGGGISTVMGSIVGAIGADYTFADFPRSLLFVTAPPGAAKARIVVRQTHTGAANCYTFASQWYLGEALPAQSVASPWSEAPAGAAAGVAAKLNKNAADILSGPIALQANGAIIAGTLTTDVNGYRTGGYGVATTIQGTVAYNSAGVITFQISASTGNAYYAGQLSAAYGTFGAVSIAAGGSMTIGATGYGAGTGLWFGFHGGVPKFRVGDANQYIDWDGTKLTQKLDVFSVAITGTLASIVANGVANYGNLTASITGDTAGGVTYTWAVISYYGAVGTAQYYVSVGGETATATITGSATNNQINASTQLTVRRNSDGRIATAIRNHAPIHGTYNP